MSTDDNLKLPKEIEAYCKDEDKDRELRRPKKKELHNTVLANLYDSDDWNDNNDAIAYNQACDDWEKYHKEVLKEIRDKLGQYYDVAVTGCEPQSAISLNALLGSVHKRIREISERH